MLIQKLTVPFIKESLLQRTVHCRIASAAISDAGFQFIVSRLSSSCRIEIITGLDLPTSPEVLKAALASDRMTMKIFTNNFFHPKVYLFSLNDGAKKAFIGSGNFTLGGFQKNEELSYMISSEADVQGIDEWFTKYSNKSVPLTKEIISEYEKIYFAAKRREKQNREEKKQFNDLITGSFNWENLNLQNSYFTQEDYLTFSNENASLEDGAIKEKRIKVLNKFLLLHQQLVEHIKRWNWHPHPNSIHYVSSIDPNFQPENKVKAMWLAYGRPKEELLLYKGGLDSNNKEPKPMDFIRVQVIIRQQDFGIWLMPGKDRGSEEDREYFKQQMQSEEYRSRFYVMLIALGDPYFIDVAGDERLVTSFKDANELWEYTKKDDWRYYYFTLGRNYSPDDSKIDEGVILDTILRDFDKLHPLYILMKDKSFN